MMSVIRVDRVLREAVETPYTDLVTRSTGAAVRLRVLDALQAMVFDQAQLDFSEIGLVDFSCADEVVAKLLLELAERPLPRVSLCGLHDHHTDAIEQAVARYGRVIVAVFRQSAEPQLLGSVSDDWRAAFNALAKLGRATAMPVATMLAWPEGRAADALRELARHRCVIAHDDATFELGAAA